MPLPNEMLSWDDVAQEVSANRMKWLSVAQNGLRVVTRAAWQAVVRNKGTMPNDLRLARYDEQLAAALVNAKVLQEMLADSPYFLYRLNEPSGSQAFDYSGNGRHGTWHTHARVLRGQAPILPYEFEPCARLQLDAFPAYNPTYVVKSAPVGAVNNALSIAWWTKGADSGQPSMVITKDARTDASGRSDALFWSAHAGSMVEGWLSSHGGSGATQVQVVSKERVAQSANPDYTVWTWDGTYVRIYVNGVERYFAPSMGSETTPGVLYGSPYTSTGVLVVGGHAGGTNGELQSAAGTAGLYQHVALYKSCLSPARILAQYNAGIFNT